ncbi:MAG: hypothetical protein AAF709_09305 [Pseudomonadota bacterium]
MRSYVFSELPAIAAASLCLIGTSACMGPPMGGHGMVQSGQSAQVAASFDPTGNWCFEDGSQTNYVSNAGGALTVTPMRGNGRSATYIQVGDRLYRDADGPGTYEFVSSDTAVWRANNSSRQMIYLLAC